MESLLLVVHVVVALTIVGLIMLQQGKGAEMGASFGSGSSQTVFGAAGSGNFFSRLTAVLVTVFFVTSFTLAILAKNSVSIDDVTDSDVPVLEEASTTSDIETEGDATMPTLTEDAGEESVMPELSSEEDVTVEVEESSDPMEDAETE